MDVYVKCLVLNYGVAMKLVRYTCNFLEHPMTPREWINRNNLFLLVKIFMGHVETCLMEPLHQNN